MTVIAAIIRSQIQQVNQLSADPEGHRGGY